MKMLLSPCLLLSAVILAGCGTMKIETGAPVFAPPGDKGTASREALQERTEFGGLFQAANQMGLGPQGKAARSPEGPLPSALVSSPLMQKLVKANLYAVQAGTGRGLSNENFEDIQFKRRDFKHFVLNVVPALGVNSWAENNQPGSHANARTTDTDRKSEAFQRIQKYLAAYVAGKFVDRSGAFIAKPKIENNKIGNDSIVGFLTVILEATYDCLYSTPVFYETNSGKIVWLNAGGKEPCFAALAKDDQGSYNVKFVQEVSNTSNITTSEVNAMQFFASVASDQ